MDCRTFQIANAFLEPATRYGFGALKAADPLKNAEAEHAPTALPTICAYRSPGQLGNTFDRQACATQSVAQDFPPLAHADRMRLQDPACHRLVGRSG